MSSLPERPSFGSWMGSMWLYTVLRFALFFVLWGIFYLAGLHSVFAPMLALLASVPLSYVLLARPRARFAATIEQRVAAARAQRERLDHQLAGDELAGDEDDARP